MTIFLRPREHIASGIRQIEEARANHRESIGDEQDSGQMVDMAKLADLVLLLMQSKFREARVSLRSM
jgi:hypothetical protein